MKSNTQNFYSKLLPVDYVLKNFEEIKLEKKYSDMLKDGKIVYISKYNKNLEKEKDTAFDNLVKKLF